MTFLWITFGVIVIIAWFLPASTGAHSERFSKRRAQEHLLWQMRTFSLPEVYKKAFDLMKEYPEYDLENYPPFRSWYKTFIDTYNEDGCIRLKNGGTYRTKDDPLYDPDAPDWYDTYYIYRDDVEEEKEDDGEDLVAKVLEKRRVERMTWRERKRYERNKH